MPGRYSYAGAVNVVRFNCNGTLLASGGDDRTIILWELRYGGQLLWPGRIAESIFCFVKSLHEIIGKCRMLFQRALGSHIGYRTPPHTPGAGVSSRRVGDKSIIYWRSPGTRATCRPGSAMTSTWNHGSRSRACASTTLVCYVAALELLRGMLCSSDGGTAA
jgi:WD40 repeat protein